VRVRTFLALFLNRWQRFLLNFFHRPNPLWEFLTVRFQRNRVVHTSLQAAACFVLRAFVFWSGTLALIVEKWSVDDALTHVRVDIFDTGRYRREHGLRTLSNLFVLEQVQPLNFLIILLSILHLLLYQIYRDFRLPHLLLLTPSQRHFQHIVQVQTTFRILQYLVKLLIIQHLILIMEIIIYFHIYF